MGEFHSKVRGDEGIQLPAPSSTNVCSEDGREFPLWPSCTLPLVPGRPEREIFTGAKTEEEGKKEKEKKTHTKKHTHSYYTSRPDPYLSLFSFRRVYMGM